jgi:hypothetical protein
MVDDMMVRGEVVSNEPLDLQPATAGGRPEGRTELESHVPMLVAGEERGVLVEQRAGQRDRGDGIPVQCPEYECPGATRNRSSSTMVVVPRS